MIKIVEKYVTIWNTRGFDGLVNILTGEARYWDAMQEGEANELLSNAIVATHDAFPDVSFEILSLSPVVQGRCFLEWKMTGTNTGSFFGYDPTGRSIEINGLDSIVFESDRIAEIKSFYESSLFNQQLAIG